MGLRPFLLGGFSLGASFLGDFDLEDYYDQVFVLAYNVPGFVCPIDGMDPKMRAAMVSRTVEQKQDEARAREKALEASKR